LLYLCVMNIQKITQWIVPFIYVIFSIPILQWGSGISPDSCAYLSAANNLHAGNGFIIYDQTYMTNWPWLYPIILTGFSFISPSLLVLAGLANLAFGVTTYLILHQTLKETRSKFLLALCFLFPPFIKMHIMLWSEPIFLLLLILGLRIWLDETKHNTIHLASMFMAFAAACLIRYAGVFIVTGLIITQLVQPKIITRKFIVTSLALLPISLNLWYNSYHSIQIVNNNLAWHQLQNSWHNMFHNLGNFLMQLCMISLLLLVAKKSIQKTKSLVWAGAIYWFVIVVFAPLTAAELLRYALPIVPLFIWIMDEELTPLPIKNKWAIPMLGIMLIAAGYFNYYSIKNGTGGYNKRSMENTALKNYLKTNTGKIYSNAPDYIYFISKKSAELLKQTSTLTRTDEVIVVDQVTRKTDWPSEQVLVPSNHQEGFTCYKLQ
jgi:hypothetical protein